VPVVDLDLAFSPASAIAARVAAGELSPVEVVENALVRIADVNGQLNCFCTVRGEEAVQSARAAAEAVARRAPLGPLHGVPVALKDTTPTAGHRTTLGSYTHEHWVPDHDAWIARALAQAGAIVVGTTTTPEFAHTLVTDSPLWGVTRNPWDPRRTPGGSSGGSAAAVAAGCVPLAEGTDMGGSVRIPAAWCGIVGLKPGLGRIPMDVLPGLFDTISHHGPLARGVDDARLFLAATQGPDDADILSSPCPLDLTRPVAGDVVGRRLALSVDLGCWAVEPAIEEAVRRAAAALEAAGAVVEEVDVGLTARHDDSWAELWAVFMAANYGHLVEQHAHHMDPDVLALIERGNSLSAVEYKRLDLVRTDIWRRLVPVLADHDALLCPTTSTGPPPAEKADRSVEPPPDDGRHHGRDMTGIFNLVSPCPALSVPCGFDPDGLPIGLQIVGRRWREDTVLTIGRAVELTGLGRPPSRPLV
jgi:Asp-tRNA(Asn)/Glu-tRNA(Gln) amidotransferase A subunit family amidase